MNTIEKFAADNSIARKAAVLDEIRCALPDRPTVVERLSASLDACTGADVAAVAMPRQAGGDMQRAAWAGVLFAAVGGGAGQVIDRRAFAEHSAAVALLARRLCENRIDASLGAAAFVAGLLHDIGKLILDAVFPRSYQRAVRRAYARGGDICELERETLGIDHTEAGRRVARIWNLPVAFERCIRSHHQPLGCLLPDDVPGKLLTAVQVANVCVRQCDLDTYYGSSDGSLESAADIVQLRVDELAELARSVRGSESFGQCTGYLFDAMARGASTSRVVGRGSAPMATPFGSSADPSIVARGGDRSDDLPTACAGAADWARRQLGLRWAVVTAADETVQRDVVGVATQTGVKSRMIDRRDRHQADGLPGSERSAMPPDVAPVMPAVSAVADLLTACGIHDVPRFIPLNSFASSQGYLVIAQVDYQSGSWGPLTEIDGDHAESLDRIAAAINARLLEARHRACTLELVEQARCQMRRSIPVGEYAGDRDWRDILARMAGGAAHELNNPLAVILARAQMLRETAGDEQSSRQLGIIIEQADRATGLIQEMITTSRLRTTSPRRIRLVRWAHRLRQRWQRRYSIDPRAIEIDIRDPRVCLFADADQLTRAADEIMANTRAAATDENLRLQINSRSMCTDETIVVSFVDSAGGMSGEVLKRATIPFFSFRPAGRGRGLGLVRAQALVDSNGGTLRIRSVPGIGTNVSFHLPAAPPSR